MKPKLKQPGTKRLKLKCDILLLTSAFKFNLRHYSKGAFGGLEAAPGVGATLSADGTERLTQRRDPLGQLSSTLSTLKLGIETRSKEEARANISGPFSGRNGKAVQVDPIKPTLKAHGNKRLKLNVINCLQLLLSISTCAATQRRHQFRRRRRLLAHVGRAWSLQVSGVVQMAFNAS